MFLFVLAYQNHIEQRGPPPGGAWWVQFNIGSVLGTIPVNMDPLHLLPLQPSEPIASESVSCHPVQNLVWWLWQIFCQNNNNKVISIFPACRSFISWPSIVSSARGRWARFFSFLSHSGICTQKVTFLIDFALTSYHDMLVMASQCAQNQVKGYDHEIAPGVGPFWLHLLSVHP